MFILLASVTQQNRTAFGYRDTQCLFLKTEVARIRGKGARAKAVAPAHRYIASVDVKRNCFHCGFISETHMEHHPTNPKYKCPFNGLRDG